MNELLTIDNAGRPVASSRDIAEHFGKRHDHVVRDIEELLGGLPNFGETPLFFKTEYIHPQNGQSYPMYLMTRDGFTLLAMGFTGKSALEWKLKYINAFNQMEAHIKEQSAAKPMTLAEQALAQAQILVDHEKQLAELSESVNKLERFNDGIVAVLAPTAVSDGWQEQMNRKVRQYCLDYDLDYRVAFNQLYMTVESSTRSDLTRRVENRRKRILQNGGTRAEADKVTKLSVIANDAALRNAFDLALKNMCVASYARHGDELGV